VPVEQLEEVASISIAILTDGSMRMFCSGVEDTEEGQEFIRMVLMRAFSLMVDRPHGTVIQ